MHSIRLIVNRRSWPYLLAGQVLLCAFLLWCGDALLDMPDDLTERLPGYTYFLGLVTMAVGGIVAQRSPGWYQPTRRPLANYFSGLLALVALVPVLVLPVLGLLYIWFAARGETGPTADLLTGTAWGLALGVVAAWTGASLTLIVGHWSAVTMLAALVAFFELFEISDGYGNPTMNQVGHWMPRINYDAVIQHGTDYEIYVRGQNFRSTGTAERSFEAGLTFFGWVVVAVVVLGALAAVVRTRRSRTPTVDRPASRCWR
ncbi:hypothetical protein ACFTSF_12665 [Kribbella sp. NPDC056951]|uniref:hypothetical protein n=1 Tax=Kribbella sp. NPDC056951 TaxID=3345978 RepID=UPI00362915E6